MGPRTRTRTVQAAEMFRPRRDELLNMKRPYWQFFTGETYLQTELCPLTRRA